MSITDDQLYRLLGRSLGAAEQQAEELYQRGEDDVWDVLDLTRRALVALTAATATTWPARP
jgi:hypothetical protein